jgi:hypothetical protein
MSPRRLTYILILALPFFLALVPRPPAQAQTLDDFRPPLKYPCDFVTYPEFHPLRPYPGSPCQPLIPRKIPEAPDSTNPYHKYLTFKCSKSLNVSGSQTVTDVVNICGMPMLPANPLDALPPGSCYGPTYCEAYSTPANCLAQPNCFWTGPQDTSQLYRCDSISRNICFVKKIVWDVQLDLSAAQLPFMGNTELELPDPDKVNQYLSWYLNGTIFQSEQEPLNSVLHPSDSTRITTSSGPLNKLLPKDVRDTIKYTLYSGAEDTGAYHNYVVACRRNINIPYVLSILIRIFRLVFGSIFDAARIAHIVLTEGWERLNLTGQVIIEFLNLPAGQHDVTHFAQIALHYNLTQLGNNLGDLQALIDIGESQLRLVGLLIQAVRLDLIESCSTSNNVWRLTRLDNNPQPEFFPYVPYSTLEDTTGEVTVGIIPDSQPADIDGTILSIGLTINSPSDSRLYFPHMKAALALSSILEALHKPLISPTPALDVADRSLVRQRISQFQGVDDSTPIQREYNSNGQLIRNTEVIEGQPAPPPLYDADPICDLPEAWTNPGDNLMADAINATLTYYQLFRWSPELLIACPCPAGFSGCVSQPCVEEHRSCIGRTGPTACCWGNCPNPPPPPSMCIGPTFCEGLGQSACEALTASGCSWTTPSDYGICIGPTYCEPLDVDACLTTLNCFWTGTRPITRCPAWPTTDLRSAARHSVFTKTPLIERIYDILIADPMSVLRRWLPKLPLTATSSWEIATGRENTIPAASGVTYLGSTADLQNGRVSAGLGGSGALYFPHLGSLSDYILDPPTQTNLNLQRLLRPKGFAGGTSASSGLINCNVNLPPQTAACVSRSNYVSVANRWFNPPRGTPYADLCFDDVVYRARAAGVPPGLALLAWLNECDTSNYGAVGTCWDFGVVSQPQNNFSSQLNAYLAHANLIRLACARELSGGVDPVEVYASRYITRYCSLAEIQNGGDSAYYNYVRGYIIAMNNLWRTIGGGCSFPFP